MVEPIRYSHTNLVARDWRRLAAFYQEVFHCKPKPPERDLRGEWLDAATGMKAAHIKGIHLILPGQGENGPTLEIFEYHDASPRKAGQLNDPGLVHLAFAVEDVEMTLERLLKAGGSRIGDIVTTEIPQAGCIEFVYARDPEGNIVEIQKWG